MKKILLAASLVGLLGYAFANTSNDDDKDKKKSCSKKSSCCSSKKGGKKSCDMKGEKTDAPAGETKPAEEKK